MRLLLFLALAASLPAADEKTTALGQLSGSLERLAAKVAPAVVQVQVSAWCASDSPNRESSGVLSACKVVGSGVIVDPSGYIISNEHVVRNARRIRVMLTPKSDLAADGPLAVNKRPALDTVITDADREPLGKRQVLDAVVVGMNRETDIAVLKIDASGLPAIALDQTRDPRQGQVVLAVGSPEGLDNTMTIGIISAVGRQPHPDYPMLYIQTDASINPGNSGGPLLNVEGELVGINTFILSESGRNQGLGFAVPAAVARYVYEQLRAHGVVRQSMVGAMVQTVTPTLAQGLGLTRGYGVMIRDVLAGSPADSAGLRPLDIVTAIDDAPISTLPYYTALMYLHNPAVPVAVTVLRGQEILQFHVPAVAVDERAFAETSIDPHESLVPEVGIFGIPVNRMVALQEGIRSGSGIYVAAMAASNQESLEPGDVIISLNGKPVRDLRELRDALHEIPEGKPAVFKIERHCQFLYIERELQ